MVANGTKITWEGVTIILRNFSGEKDRFNEKEKKRNFGVLLDVKTAEAMEADEWNIKWFEPRDEDEGEERQPWLPVELRFDTRPPTVIAIPDGDVTRRRQLTEEQVGMLDDADFTNVDIIIRAHVYNVNEKTGVKAYCKALYVTIEEDDLERKYNALAEEQLQ